MVYKSSKVRHRFPAKSALEPQISGPPKQVYISTQHYAFKAADHMKVGRQESQVASLDLRLFDAWKK